jgi:hypothetical protein
VKVADAWEAAQSAAAEERRRAAGGRRRRGGGGDGGSEEEPSGRSGGGGGPAGAELRGESSLLGLPQRGTLAGGGAAEGAPLPAKASFRVGGAMGSAWDAAAPRPPQGGWASAAEAQAAADEIGRWGWG